jgi:hypothetical protein
MEMTDEQRKNLSKRIKDRARRFEKLNINRKRVAVAKDVIKMLNSGSIDSTNRSGYLRRFDGYDFSGNKSEFDLWTKLNAEAVPLHEVIESNKCRVCALGGMLAAFVMKVDSLSVEKGRFDVTRDDIEKKLGEIFSFDQMDMIELTFEKTECPAFVENQIESADMRRRCHEFGIEHRSKNELLIAIMRNIIEHDGEFIP